MPPRKRAPKEMPFFRFPHSQELRDETLAVLDAIDDPDNDPLEYKDELSVVINSLMDAGMKYFFLVPMKRLQLNAVVYQSGVIGLMGVLGIVAPMVRNVLGHLSAKQLREVSKIMREMMK